MGHDPQSVSRMLAILRVRPEAERGAGGWRQVHQQIISRKTVVGPGSVMRCASPNWHGALGIPKSAWRPRTPLSTSILCKCIWVYNVSWR